MSGRDDLLILNERPTEVADGSQSAYVTKVQAFINCHLFSEGSCGNSLRNQLLYSRCEANERPAISVTTSDSWKLPSGPLYE